MNELNRDHSMLDPLTERQLDVLKAIVAYSATHDLAPKSREIADLLEVSRQTLDEHLGALMRKKYIEQRLSRHRSIVLTAAGRDAITRVCA